MFAHNKRLQYTVRVSEPNPGLANLMLEQFGGPQGELAAAMRYFTQAVSEDDPGRKDMLFDIATEELSHLEIIGHIVAMLNKGAKGELAEAVDSEAELYRKLHGAGNDSHVTQVLYGAGTPLVNSAGVPWTAAYIDTIGEPTADLRSNIADVITRAGFPPVHLAEINFEVFYQQRQQAIAEAAAAAPAADATH